MTPNVDSYLPTTSWTVEVLEHVKKYEKKFTITSPLFLACKKERKKENSISDRDKCLDKISNGSKCTLSDILDRWSSQGQDSIEWEKYRDENHEMEPTHIEQ